MSEEEEFKFIMNGLCFINRISVILNKVIVQEELTKNELKIVKQVIKMKGFDEV